MADYGRPYGAIDGRSASSERLEATAPDGGAVSPVLSVRRVWEYRAAALLGAAAVAVVVGGYKVDQAASSASVVAAAAAAAAAGASGSETPSSASATTASTNLAAQTTLEIRAHNKYTKLYGAVRSSEYYPWLRERLVVEPYRNTTLSVIGVPDDQDWYVQWKVTLPSQDVVSLGTPNEAHTSKGYTFDEVSAFYTLTVAAYSFSGRDFTLQAEATVTAACKYVRRELRALDDIDRAQLLYALRELHTLSSAEGTAKYGDDFVSYVTLTSMHNSREYCYHDGMQFMTSHPMFSLMVDRSLQLVSPELTLPYWDFLLDGEQFGADFSRSEVYSEDLFGSVDNGEADDYTMRAGYFKGLPHAWDLAGLIDTTNHNGWGGIFDAANQIDNQTLRRSNRFCGLANTQTWPVASDLITCMTNATSLYDWDICVEDTIHANFHGWHGGAWNCAVDFSSEPNEPRWRGQLKSGQLGFLGPLARAVWYQWAPSNNWTSCPTQNACSDHGLSTSECVCAAVFNATTLSDDKVKEYSQSLITMVLADSYQSDLWLEQSDDGEYTWKNLDSDLDLEFNRLLLKWAASPGFTGAMGGGPAANDPIFWVLHPLFERAAHAWQLSELSRGKAEDWLDSGACSGSGSGFNDTMPFPDLFTGTSAAFTNAQLWSRLNPEHATLPYIYDQFDTWGGTHFAPAPFLDRTRASGSPAAGNSTPAEWGQENNVPSSA